MTRQYLIDACRKLQRESESLQDNIPDSDSSVVMLNYWRYCRAWWCAERALSWLEGTPDSGGTIDKSLKKCSKQIARYERVSYD